jgi:adenylosuccinate synthase
VLDPVTLKRECDTVSSFGIDLKKNLFVSERTHLILPTHRALDKASEISKGNDKIGSTLKGIGPTYMDKTGRNGLRVGDLIRGDFKSAYDKLCNKHRQLLEAYSFHEDISAWEKEFFEAIGFLKAMNIVSGEYFINDHLSAGKRVLAEGAQGSMLDIDFGTFPFVTSSNTITAGVCSGLGVAPQKIKDVLGVTKAYCTRVGGGPFPTELNDPVGDELRKVGNEFGATTGRPRRCGWIDLVALKFACMINGVTKIVMTKADVLDAFDELQVCTAYNTDGNNTEEVPYQMTGINLNPVYKKFKGWKTDSSVLKNEKELPAAMQQLINTWG